MEMSIVNVTSRQVAPFQALVNMIKIIYMNKPEVFKTLITILCDYDQNNSDCIVKTIRYIHVLLSCNPDLADYLISFLPEPTPILSNLTDRPSGPTTVSSDSSPIKQTKYRFHSTKASSSIKESHGSTNYSESNTSCNNKDFLGRTQESRHHVSNEKPVGQTKYKFRSTKSTPSVKESQLNTSYSVTTTSCDVKPITSTQFGYSEVSPHLRPLMVPQAGGAANHFHVTKSETDKLTRDVVFPGQHSPLFPQPLASSNLGFDAGEHSAEPNPPKREKLSFDSWSFAQNRAIHPLLESTRPICSIKQETGTYDQCTFLSPSTQLMSGIGQTTSVSNTVTLGVNPKFAESYQATSWSSSADNFSQHINQANPGIHLQMHMTTPFPVNQHLGLRLPLNKLVYEGTRQVYTNPDLSHLMTMTRPISSTVLHPSQGFKQPNQEPVTPTTTISSFQFPYVGKQMDSLKELSTKLKIAEQTIKQTQFSRLTSVSKSQGSIKYKISSVPLQFSDSVQPTPDPNIVKHIKSFPYVQRIVLADGGISTFKIDENAELTDVTVLPKQHKKATKQCKHHVIRCKHKKKKNKRDHQKVEENASLTEENKSSS